jgi:hypothetical protein
VVIGKNYLAKLRERSRKNRVYKNYQLTGLIIAELLNDRAHKALYIRLAKEFDDTILLPRAKRIAGLKNIRNKGAYFMKLLADPVLKKYRKVLPRKIKPKKMIQRTLFGNGNGKNRHNRK